MLDEVKHLWKLFEIEYAAKDVQSFEFPHVTSQASQCPDVLRVKEAFVALARQLQPFEVLIDGLAYFEPSPKVVFLKVQPTEALRREHVAVHHMLGQYGENLFQSYLPENWIPPVTVATNDLTEAEFRRALHDLREYDPYYCQVISNIHLHIHAGKRDVSKSSPGLA